MPRPRVACRFRVHYVDGTKLTVTATSAADARRQATCLEGSPAVDLETGEPTDGVIGTFTYGALA